MIGTRNPYRAIVFEFVATKGNPLHIEIVHFIRCHSLVPFSFIHAYNFSTLYADTTVGKEIRRVGKHHIELEVELRQ